MITMEMIDEFNCKRETDVVGRPRLLSVRSQQPPDRCVTALCILVLKMNRTKEMRKMMMVMSEATTCCMPHDAGI